MQARAAGTAQQTPTLIFKNASNSSAGTLISTPVSVSKANSQVFILMHFDLDFYHQEIFFFCFRRQHQILLHCQAIYLFDRRRLQQVYRMHKKPLPPLASNGW
jgi:hypothetical protein